MLLICGSKGHLVKKYKHCIPPFFTSSIIRKKPGLSNPVPEKPSSTYWVTGFPANSCPFFKKSSNSFLWYSQDISDKVKSSLAARRKKGLYIGSIPPYGYRRDRDGLLEPDKPHLHKRENMLDIVSQFDVIPAKTGKILDYNALYPPFFYVLHHP